MSHPRIWSVPCICSLPFRFLQLIWLTTSRYLLSKHILFLVLLNSISLLFFKEGCKVGRQRAASYCISACLDLNLNLLLNANTRSVVTFLWACHYWTSSPAGLKMVGRKWEACKSAIHPCSRESSLYCFHWRGKQRSNPLVEHGFATFQVWDFARKFVRLGTQKNICHNPSTHWNIIMVVLDHVSVGCP